jgi:uncharacterized protein (TIGR02145 family)
VKKSIFIYAIAFITIISSACKKEETTVVLTPTLTTATATDVKNTTASSGGTITSDNGSAIKAFGVCWSLNTNPTIADSKTINGSGNVTFFTSAITGLARVKTYHVRAYATNANGTGYGNDITINTLGVQDIEGKIYNTIKIGNQEWMAENLSVTKFNNGNAISKLSSIIDWSSRTTAAYCEYDNTIANSKVYGYLYNWYAATDPRNIAPAGWRIPTQQDWTTLYNFLGGSNGALNALKESGIAHWLPANVDATNSSGFTALPGGYCSSAGSYNALKNWGCWWKYDATDPKVFILTADPDELLHIGFDKKDGYSIRCIKN